MAKKNEFVQEYAYIYDERMSEVEQKPKEDNKKDNSRGVVIIDILGNDEEDV